MKPAKLITFILFLYFGLIVSAQTNGDSLNLKSKQRPKIGLVLSGGGAKGLAHIGVLKVLEECGIRPDYITGTSMGSIVGGLYSLGYTASEIEQFVLKADWSVLLSDKITWRDVAAFHKDEYPSYSLKFIFNKGHKPGLPSGMIEGQEIHALLLKLCWSSNQYKSFDEFPIPFRCVATDIMSGQPIVFKDGNLADALRCSMSIPSIFSPVIKDSLLLADGGMVRNYPVQECLDMGADIIIGSYTGFNENAKPEDIQSIVKILARSSLFQGINDAKIQLPKTDVLIVPDLIGLGPENFGKADRIILAGEKAARDSAIYNRLLKYRNVDSSQVKIQKTKSIKKIGIDQITVHGLPSTDNRLIGELCNIYINTKVAPDILNDAIYKLYASGDYKNVSYQIFNEQNQNVLSFNFKEREAGKIEFGLHYDNTYGAAVVSRFSYRNYLFKSSLFKLKLSVSENPQLNFDYNIYLTKGKKLALFIESYVNAGKMPNVQSSIDSVSALGYFLYSQFNYKIGIKLQLHKNTMIETSVGQDFNAMRMKEGVQNVFNLGKMNYLDYFAMINFNLNNLDDPFFPQRGIYLDCSYKWVIDSKMNSDNEQLYPGGLSSKNGVLSFDYRQYISILKRFSIIPHFRFGLTENKPFLTEGFYIGGNNYQGPRNTINMSGLKTNSLVADNFVKFGIGLQLRIFERWFIQYGNELIAFIDYKQVYAPKDIIINEKITGWYTGIGVSTPIGPINVICSRNNKQKELVWLFNLGIPF
jgi:NTE family protein